MSSLDFINKIITDQDNNNFTTTPTKEEIKNIIFTVNLESVAGPGGFPLFSFKKYGRFAHDLTNLVSLFFAGNDLPRYITHTCLVRIPKVDRPEAMTNQSV